MWWLGCAKMLRALAVVGAAVASCGALERPGRVASPLEAQIWAARRIDDGGSCRDDALDWAKLRARLTSSDARLLVLHEGLPSEALLPTADLFRAQGVRLRNCFMNVGKPRYAFNFFQRKMLPKEYRPPKETIGPVAS